MKKKTFTTLTAGLLFFTSLSGQAFAHEKNYTVKSGDVLWKIAANNSVNIRDIMSWNNLTASSVIYPGQVLSLLPKHDHTTYTVRSGDMLWKIAQQYNTTIAAIKEANHLTSASIRVGQVLVIRTTASEETEADTYTVKSGDLLWKIAVEHQLTVEQLKQLNNLTSNIIYPGQVLKVANTESTELGTADSESSAELTHTVKSGETLWIISNLYKVTINQIKTLNGLTSDELRIGQVLKIPDPTTHVDEATPAAVPTMLEDGIFPLKAGTYQPYSNNYADSRSWSPDGTAVRTHEGIDIMADKGTPIYSATNGKVVNVGWSEYGGWRLTIKANDLTAIYYAHMENYAETFNDGDFISKGQLIGYVGNSGYGPEGTTGKFVPHLHFGMYNTADNWSSFSPYPYLTYWESKQ